MLTDLAPLEDRLWLVIDVTRPGSRAGRRITWIQ
jgi:hypothetical protein